MDLYLNPRHLPRHRRGIHSLPSRHQRTYIPPKAPQKKKRARCGRSLDEFHITSSLGELSLKQNIVCNGSNVETQTYRKCAFIAKGSFGIVCTVQSVDENNKYYGTHLALKVFQDIRKQRHFLVEKEILKTLQSHIYHDNVCKFLFYGFDVSGRLYQAFEYYSNGTLEQLINCQDQKLNLLQIIQILKQINKGLIHIHKYDIVHLDLKPDNIFVSVNPICFKIGDFGISGFIGERDQTTIKLHSGDPIYIAPELLESISHIFHLNEHNIENIKKVDVFSLGIIILEMLYDVKLPSQGPLFAYSRNIDREQCIEWNKFGHQPIDPSMKLILSEMLYKDPNDRISSIKLLQNIETYFDFDIDDQSSVNKLKTPNPIESIVYPDRGIDEILKDEFVINVNTCESFEPIPEYLRQFMDFTLVHTEEQLNMAFLLA